MINVTSSTNFVTIPQPLPTQPTDQPFDLLLGSVATAVPEIAVAPAAPQPAGSIEAEALESGTTLLAFLGFNPIKAPPGETISKEPLPPTEDEDEVSASDTATPTATASVSQYQPLIATILARNPVSAEAGEAPTQETLTRTDRPVGAAPLRFAPAVASVINQIADTAIEPATPTDADTVSPEPFAAAARAAALAQNAPPIVATNDPVARPSPALSDAARSDSAQLAIAASLASSTLVRSPQPATNVSDVPEERIGDIELLGTSPTTSATSLPTSSLTNGPTTTIAVTQPDPLQTIADRQLDLARDTRWIDELARDIVSSSGRSDRLSFSLVPPQLGQLHVDLSHSDLGLSVHMRSDSEATTQIVGAAQPRLVEELKSQGIRVASTEVSTGGGQSQGQNQQQRDDSQLFEFARQRFETSDDSKTDRPGGRFA